MGCRSFAVKIPIENLYYLLCYAWNRLDEAEVVGVDIEPETKVLDLLAKVLVSGVNHVLRRGMDRGYVAYEESVYGIRGKLLFSPTLHELPRRNGKTVCAFDDLSHNIISNQIVKATALHLLHSGDLSTENRAGLTEVVRRLASVSEVVVSNALFRRVQLHRNNAFYGFLLDVCAIVHESLLPRDSKGDTRFRDFTRDEGKMASLFQNFLRNFFEREQHAFKIGSLQLRWLATGSVDDLALLPVMQTDIVAWNADSCVVIDAKYYGESLQFSQYKATVHSSHLYQMYSYLRHISSKLPQSREVNGMLIYPRASHPLNLSYSIDGYGVHIRTIDLSQPWQRIHADLLQMLCPSCGLR